MRRCQHGLILSLKINLQPFHEADLQIRRNLASYVSNHLEDSSPVKEARPPTSCHCVDVKLRGLDSHTCTPSVHELRLQ